MAWIQVRTDLHEDPAVIAMASALQISEDEVCGKLVRLWGWADEQTTDGKVSGVAGAWLDRKVGLQGFAAAMVRTGWLVVTDAGIEFPKFDIHNGKSAKKRSQDALRQARHRQKKGDVTQSVTDVTRDKRDMSVTKSVTREEKIREEENSPSESNTPAGLFDALAPLDLDASPDQMTEEAAFLGSLPGSTDGWNQIEAAAGRGYQALPSGLSRQFWRIRGDPELWPLCQQAMQKMRNGLQNGAKIGLEKFLTEQTIRDIVGGKHDFTPGQSRGRLGLNAVPEAKPEGRGGQGAGGAEPVDL